MNAESAEKELGAHSQLLVLSFDITNDVQVKEAVAETVLKFGRIDVLVNNGVPVLSCGEFDFRN